MMKPALGTRSECHLRGISLISLILEYVRHHSELKAVEDVIYGDSKVLKLFFTKNVIHVQQDGVTQSFYTDVAAELCLDSEVSGAWRFAIHLRKVLVGCLEHGEKGIVTE